MPTSAIPTAGSKSATDVVLGEILREIAVPSDVLQEAKKRRDLVLSIAVEHDAARESYVSGSVAHGTQNKPLEDADCGIKVDRRFHAFRTFGPDSDENHGPEKFIRTFSDFVTPKLRDQGYPNATVDLEGNRAIKFEFNEVVEIDDWGEVDPYVDLIVGLSRDKGGLWIPNRERASWDPGDPELHTELMTGRDRKPLRVHRAHLLRLAKRAVKRDDQIDGRSKVMYSWNLSALALRSVDEVQGLGAGLVELFAFSAESISQSLTDDPSPVVEEPLKLPDGITNQMAAARLNEMSEVVRSAMEQTSEGDARRIVAGLYGEEIDSIRSREQKKLSTGLRSGDRAAVASVLGVTAKPKPTRSYRA